jgi:aldose 1-epimerase
MAREVRWLPGLLVSTRTMCALLMLCLITVAAEPPAPKPLVKEVPFMQKTSFGKLPTGEEVTKYTLDNGTMKLNLIDFGAAMQSVIVPDKNGKLENVTLGFDDMAGYLKHKAHYGCTIGRYGNRIAKGKFSLNGKEYTLATNNGPNHLHGGPGGFDRVMWKAEPLGHVLGTGIKFTYRSKDGEEGYPGNLDVTVTYILTMQNEVIIDYSAKTDADTVFNPTNHAYWNLSGVSAAGTTGGEVLDHVLQLEADKYLPVDATSIPTSELAPVAGTKFDFTKPKALGAQIDEFKAATTAMPANPNGGYDHCYVVRNSDAKKPVLAAKIRDPKSGRVLEISTTEPGIQFYTANYLDGGDINGGYKQHHAFCLETQHYPDSPNQKDFPTTTLKAGDTFHSVTSHKFSVEK